MIRRFIPALTILILLLAGQPGLAEGGLEIGAPAPTFSLGGVTLDNYLGKNVILLSFFTSWSKPCQAEAAFLQELNDTFAAKGLTIVGISFDKNQAALKTFISANKIDYAVVVDKKLKTLKDFRVLILPTLIMIDQQGKVANVYVDYDDNIKAAVKQEITRILTPPPDRD